MMKNRSIPDKDDILACEGIPQGHIEHSFTPIIAYFVNQMRVQTRYRKNLGLKFLPQLEVDLL